MADLTLRHIGKKYNEDILAVKDFNLQIKDKEFIVLVGPSGCGKSTVLRMIAGLEDMTEGELYMGEKRMNDVSPKDRDVAFVFQNYALYPHLTVYQNMAFGLKMRKFSKEEIKRRVHHAAGLLGLESFLQRKPKSLSGGQCQRVALGRAIVRDAKVFLMDEPLSNLDAKLRVQMRSEITKLHQKLETTTIYVTHDQTEALTMASRLVVMNEGVIQQIGIPKEVYEKPANVFVGGFIGSPGMNFFTGTVHLDRRIEMDGSFIQIGEEIVNKLEKAGYANKKVIMGIRPEDLYVIDSDEEDGITTRIEVKVEVLEELGAETILHASFANQPLVARIDPHFLVELGEKIQLVINLNNIHFFNPETEERLYFAGEEKTDTLLNY